MDTLTVYETILDSALLRLPRKMKIEDKRKRVFETMAELRIEHIANRRIGSKSDRGLSGGEKRRVAIACELVTSPSILFLDEPTSGLDAFNAYNVVECLVGLARQYQRTIIMTIHQPRSNIYALFDSLVLLSKGKLVYSGPAQEDALEHFADLGYSCPLGFNTADYLVDLTMHASSNLNDESCSVELEEDAFSNTSSVRQRTKSIKAEQEEQLYGNKSPQSPLYASLTSLEDTTPVDPVRTKGLNMLVKGYLLSEISKNINAEISCALNATYPSSEPHLLQRARSRADSVTRRNGLSESVNEIQRAFERRSTRRFLKASWWSQFEILSARTFKNLIRNPDLLLTQYLVSVGVALLCGLLFYKLDYTLAGFQNRMGVIFFINAVFGFSCLSSMQTFALERQIFVRERANGYYAPITYFTSKILCDIIPLRVVPPIILGMICYNLIGFLPELVHVLRFLMILVLFNLAAASVCFMVSIIFENAAVANLIATLVMLFEMLFGGLLLNKAKTPVSLRWIHRLSFFNYAFEALVVNECLDLKMVETQPPLDKIQIPGALVLDRLGLNALGFWDDTYALVTMTCSFLAIAYIWMQLFVREKR
jgi:ABC-type multidrug transport system ATPase subunit